MKYTPLLLILALLLTCGCVTNNKRTGRSTLSAGIPGIGTIEGGSSTPPDKNVGSSIYAERVEITGKAAEILAAIIAGGNMADLQNLKEKAENPVTPPE